MCPTGFHMNIQEFKNGLNYDFELFLKYTLLHAQILKCNSYHGISRVALHFGKIS